MLYLSSPEVFKAFLTFWLVPFHIIQVSLCHMACQVGNGVGGIEEVTFLYRLTPGACPKSYGVNVARLAGKIIWTSLPLCCQGRV